MQGPAVAEALSDLQTKLSRRQRRVLFLVADLGEVGPSTASAELDMSVSTAFRDLVTLQEMGLVQSDENGKRSLTPLGARVIAVDRIAMLLHGSPVSLSFVRRVRHARQPGFYMEETLSRIEPLMPQSSFSTWLKGTDR